MAPCLTGPRNQLSLPLRGVQCLRARGKQVPATSSTSTLILIMNTLDRSSLSARILKPLGLLLICFVCALAGSAWADNATWTGGGNPDGQWTNGLNWAGGVVPANPLPFSAYNTAD